VTTVLLSLVPILLVTAGVVVGILLFEKKRADQIAADRHDYRSQPKDRGVPPQGEKPTS
jgi:hypothetical protein